MPLPASDSEMGILRHKNDKPAKAKRAGKKPVAPRSGKAKGSSATKAAKSRTRSSPRKGKRGADKSTAVTTPTQIDKKVDPPKLNLDSGQDGATTPPLSVADPASPRAANTVTGERRRWPERSGPATAYSDARRAGSIGRAESGNIGDSQPRPNKLVPTNAVHPTERRIKRRMHKSGAFMAAAVAAVLGVLILVNQSEPPELVLGDRQFASRLPAAQDWPTGATSETAPKMASRARAADGDSPRVTAPAPSARQINIAREQRLAARTQQAVSTNGLSRVDMVEMERILSRLDLADSAPDGVVDDDTTQAIRQYQEFAGLPVNGEASQDLLTDMREVVKILDGGS